MSPKALKTAATVTTTAATGLSAAFPHQAPLIVALSTILNFVLGLFHPQA